MLDQAGRPLLTPPVRLQRLDTPDGPRWACDIEECRWRERDEAAGQAVCSWAHVSGVPLGNRVDLFSGGERCAATCVARTGDCGRYVPRWMAYDSLRGQWVELAAVGNGHGNSVAPRARGGTS